MSLNNHNLTNKCNEFSEVVKAQCQEVLWSRVSQFKSNFNNKHFINLVDASSVWYF
jgi:hypothetical protein